MGRGCCFSRREGWKKEVQIEGGESEGPSLGMQLLCGCELSLAVGVVTGKNLVHSFGHSCQKLCTFPGK